jgi:tetratricopeptide (TPR) repeat protein
VLFESLNRLDEARKDLERCQGLAGNPAVRAETLLHLGRVCLAQGDRQAARKWLHEAREIMRQQEVGTDAEQIEITRLLEKAS